MLKLTFFAIALAAVGFFSNKSVESVTSLNQVVLKKTADNFDAKKNECLLVKVISDTHIFRCPESYAEVDTPESPVSANAMSHMVVNALEPSKKEATAVCHFGYAFIKSQDGSMHQVKSTAGHGVRCKKNQH